MRANAVHRLIRLVLEFKAAAQRVGVALREHARSLSWGAKSMELVTVATPWLKAQEKTQNYKKAQITSACDMPFVNVQSRLSELLFFFLSRRFASILLAQHVLYKPA